MSIQITDCVDELETLHQFTGQCWSDASLIHLWFAGGIGPIVQAELEKESFLEDFESFYFNNNTFYNLRHYYPSLHDKREVYTPFIFILIQYATEMKERYRNWKHPTKIPSLRRTSSCTLSTKLEYNGILLGEMLKQSPTPKLQKKNVEALYKKIESINVSQLQNLAESNVVKRLEENLAESGKGYNLFDFGGVLYVLLKFFLRNQQLYVHHKRFDEETRKIQYFNYFLNEIKNYNIQGTYLELNTLAFLGPEVNHSFLYQQMDETIHLSFLASCAFLEQGKVENPKQHHALSFLTCSNLETMIYDDNLGKLRSVPWPAIFRKMTTQVREKYANDNDVHLEVYLMYMLTKEACKENLKEIVKTRNLFNSLREDILQHNTSSTQYETRYKLFKKLMDIEKNIKGLDYHYTDIFIEKPSYTEEELKKLFDDTIIDESIYTMFLKRLEGERFDIEFRLKFSQGIQEFQASDETFTGSILERIIDFQPLFCLADLTKKEHIFYDSSGNEMIIKDNDLDSFTLFFLEINSQSMKNLFTFLVRSLYKMKDMNSLIFFVKNNEKEHRDQAFSNAYPTLTNKKVQNKNNNNDPYGGGKRKTRSKKNKFRKTRKH